jgi:acyl-CoA thioester hydrolase
MAAMQADPDPARPGVARCRVTYRMTDKMGVVYYGNYMELFEMGRAELLRSTGRDYVEMERDGFHLPVIHAEADYIAPARYNDILAIQTCVRLASRVKLEFEYEIRREFPAVEAQPAGVLLCRGKTTHIIAGDDGRPRRLSAEWLEHLGGIGQEK